MAQTQRRVGGLRLAGRVGRTRLLVILAMVGPGFIAANAGNDAGGITTWSVIGSRYGYSMIWLLVLITPVLAIVQEMNARVGRRHGTRAGRPHPRELQPQDHRPRDPRHADRQLRHHRGGVLGRGRGEQPLPRASLRGRARGRRGRLAARHPRLLPQGGAGAPRPRLRAADLRRLRHPRRARLERGTARRDAPVHLSGTACGSSRSSPPSAPRSRPGASSSSRRPSSTRRCRGGSSSTPSTRSTPAPSS